VVESASIIMSIKEVNIRPKDLDFELPVKLAYQFLEKGDLPILFEKNPYIFTVIISADNKEQLVFGGGKTRIHMDLLQAIKQDKKDFNYLQENLGQVDVDEYGKIGLVKFAYCFGKDEARNQERANLIFQSISPEIFDSEIDIIYAGTIRYNYDSASRKIKGREII
jgi:hypothetical protein